MPEDCFQVADGGASGLDECQREFEATLLEYQFEDQDQDQGANTSTLSLARDQLTYNNHLEPASQASSEIPTTDLERLHDIMLGSSCIKSAFASGSKAGPNETAVLFTSSAEGRVGAWCADSGRRLFEAKLAAPLLAMKVVVAEASRSGLSRYFIFGTCMHEAVGFEVRGLDELQALADFVSSADVTTCEAYWAHAQRRAALERALGILGLQGTTQERQKLATLMDQRSRLGEAMQHHTRPQQLVHAASAEHFLRTLIGRIEKRTGRELYSRVLSATREIDLNTETLCKCIVSCPFAIEGILDAIAMPATTFLRSTSLEKDRFMQAVKGTSGEPPRAFLERLGLVILPLAQRNAWGGDARVGMFLKPAPFFYACTDASAAEAASTANALAAGNPLIAPLYALGEAKEAEEVRKLQEAHEREMQRDAEIQDQILSPPLLVRQLEVPHVPEKRDPISPCSGPSKRSPSPHGDLADQASTSCTPTLPYASDASEIALHSAGLAVDVNAALKLDALPTKSLAAYTEELSLAGSETSKLQRPKADWFRPGAVVSKADARSDGHGDLWTGEFCCLFYGYRTRCQACPLPKGVQDLFEDGTLNASRFRAFGKRDQWQQRGGNDSRGPAGAMHDRSLAQYEMSLAALGLGEKRPKKLGEIKFAFREKAKELHPDVGGDNAAFRELVSAYELAKSLFALYRTTS
ncbi:Hypothetical Protein FCC1311_073902 [Hondaea fermentalgiana]|uniref:J domain-containing protein n=1 Tax=Hondaea fermentalgiana TaxID=2315210 RepID=A0A2R5GLI0_9STRA|nr:Hypothetical Protein FCC1311_073902 [Hondaea fermentalgiana]|eukprot:GBG31169.1 Hypothetical Protein FCC1311_073902 [Hondaea fermentalgiana]